MRAVVTGGAGFLGAHLARELAARGDEVTCLDVSGDSPLLVDHADIDLIRCDVGIWAELLHALREVRPDVVFHTAGILSAAAEERPRAAFQANALGTFNLLEAASVLGIRRVALTSTIATYGPGAGEKVGETTQQRPTTMYGVSKVCSELLGDYYAIRMGVEFRAVRLPSVIGHGRGPGGASAYSSLIVSEPAAGRPYTVPVSEGARIPILYVKDAVRALIALADTRPEQLRRRTYGLAGFSPTAAELAEAVSGAVPEARIEFAPDPDLVAIVDSWPKHVDGSEAARDWGFSEQFLLEETVRDFVGEVRAAEAPSRAAARA